MLSTISQVYLSQVQSRLRRLAGAILARVEVARSTRSVTESEMGMQCCPSCFQDKWLKAKIAELSEDEGDCPLCEAENVPLIDASELGGYFSNLLSMYEVADSFEEGECLIFLIQDDWQVFDEDALTEDQRAELLEDIANADWDDDDGEDPIDGQSLYQHVGGLLHTTHRDAWEQYCSDVRENPDEALPFEEFLTDDLAMLSVALPVGTNLHRARPGFKPGEYGEREAYKGDDIGAPPAAKAKAGRVNIDGQRVLYCADQEGTAVAEVRPARGFYVSVASVTVNREVHIIDLAKGPPGINPFITETLRWDVEIQSLLIALGEELSLPLERDGDSAHYRPSQRLADYIRGARYDGIRYPSALNPDGTNVVFFDPAVATIGESKLAKITENTLKYVEERPRQPFNPRVGAVAQDENN